MLNGIKIAVTAKDRVRLEAVVADRNSPQKHVWRAQIILLTADGCGTAEIMRGSGTSKTAVWRWQERFMVEGVAGYVACAIKAGFEPLPVTADKLMRAFDYLIEVRPSSAQERLNLWRAAFDAIPEQHRKALGLPGVSMAQSPSLPPLKRVMRNQLPAAFKTICDQTEGRPHWIAGIADYIGCCTKNGIEPLPVKPDKIMSAFEALQRVKPSAAQQRLNSWRSAFDALPHAYRSLIGLEDDKLATSRGVRKRNARDGTFPRVEQGLDTWQTEAIRPLSGPCDMRNPLQAGTASHYIRVVCVVATELLELGEIKEDVSLDCLLQQALILKWIRWRLQPRKDGSRPTIEDELTALIRITADTQGKESPLVLELANQRETRAHGLNSQDLKFLFDLLAGDKLAKIYALPHVIMDAAWDETRLSRTRIMLANVAAALAVQFELRLRPCDFCILEIDGEFGVKLKTRVRRADGPIKIAAAGRAILQRRAELYCKLGIAVPVLIFPSPEGGSMDVDVIDLTIKRVLRKMDLSGITLQVLRDLGAVQLIIENPRKLRRIADLLDFKQVCEVQRRYSAFLAGRLPKNANDKR